jgi:hypothetical protein
MITDATLAALFATLLVLAFPYWSWTSMLAAVEEQEAIVSQREDAAELRRQQDCLALRSEFGLPASDEAAERATSPEKNPVTPPRPPIPSMIGIATGGFM